VFVCKRYLTIFGRERVPNASVSAKAQVRMNNSTKELPDGEMDGYLSDRWPVPVA
jgi:hypothetical protein